MGNKLFAFLSFLFLSFYSEAQFVSTLSCVANSATIPTANLVANWDCRSSVTQSGGAVSQWTDIIGGYNFIQSTGSAKPTISGSSTSTQISFNGTSDFMTCAGFSISQPYTIYLVLEQVSNTSVDYVLSSGTGPSWTIYGPGSGTGLRLYTPGDLIVGSGGSFYVWFAELNGSSSFLAYNASTPTLQSNVANTSGLYLGCYGYGGQFSTIIVKQILFYSVAHTSTQYANVVSILRGIWSI